MTITKRERGTDGVMRYTVKKDLTDAQTDALKGKQLPASMFRDVLDHDCDVMTDDGKLLMRFRKAVLPQRHVQRFYDNVIDFARKTVSRTRNRRVPTRTHVYGYFDRWCLNHNQMFRELQVRPPARVRVTAFTMDEPEKWQQMVPLIRDIDRMYKRLAPTHYRMQRRCASETAYRIADTAFSTITTNVNTQLGAHRDANNLKGSFGNLVVVEKGEYEGGYTGFPQYKLAVDVRTGDFLAMSVFDMHGNTPIKLKTSDAQRLSVVCYLRQGVWAKSKGSTPDDVQRNIRVTRRLTRKFQVLKRGKTSK